VTPEICGACDARFVALRDALAENVTQRGELGAAVTVIVGGRVVADLWTGWADAARTRAWQRDTVVGVFSVGKALAAICALRLVADGRLDLDAPVARYWPGFVASEVTVRHVLSHRAGLPAIARPLADDALFDWETVTGALAQQQPWWAPGSAHGYHVHTFGFLVGELVRRAGGEPIDTVLAREIARPLDADVQYGLAPAQRALRADYLFDPATIARLPPSVAPADPALALRAAAYGNPPGASGVGTVNTQPWLDGVLPSANAHATARGVAQVYAALLDGRLLDAGTLAEATTEASSGEDLVLGRPSRFGLGFQLTQPERPLGPHPRSFGHFGAGGSLGFADPDRDVAFAYVMNRGGPGWQSPRNRALLDALYAALA
jgi:CubicO group peptidase (beta-lactamase class C family)